MKGFQIHSTVGDNSDWILKSEENVLRFWLLEELDICFLQQSMKS